MADERIEAAIGRLAHAAENGDWQACFTETHTLMGIFIQRAAVQRDRVAEGPSPEIGAALSMISEAATVDDLKSVAVRLKAIGLAGADRTTAIGRYSERMQELTERALGARNPAATRPAHTRTPPGPEQASLGLSGEPPPPGDDDAPR